MTSRIAWVAVLGLAMPSAALAAGVDGSKPMLCAVTEALECSYQGDCVRETPEEINIPPFVVVDVKAKTLSEYRGERKSAVQTVFEKDGDVVLQGYERRAWSAVISKETGRLSVTATAPDTGFVLFGICTDL
jgi:hypothetical protein